MFHLSIPWWEFLLRDVVVFAFLLALLRLGGKRQIAQLSPFDFVLILMISNALQNALNGGDNSLIGGLVSAAGLVALNRFLAWISVRNRKTERLLEGVPRILVHNGKLYPQVLEHEKIARDELDTALREAGAFELEQVHLAILETDGQISVHLRHA